MQKNQRNKAWPPPLRPNDPYFEQQYYFQKMQVLQAWQITQGSPDCLIGVVEMGFDATHPDLRKNLLEGYVAKGMEHPDEWLQKQHGTAVIGIIAAEAGNGIGIAGLAPNCRIVPAAVGTHPSFRMKTPEGARQWNKLVSEKGAEAIHCLVDRGCKVVNCSFTTSSTQKAAFEYAIAHDVVMVIGSGNFNRDRVNFPAGILDVLSVGGVDKDDQRWVGEPVQFQGRTITQGSNYGRGLNVVAPMRDLVVCMADDQAADAVLSDKGWGNTITWVRLCGGTCGNREREGPPTRLPWHLLWWASSVLCAPIWTARR